MKPRTWVMLGALIALCACVMPARRPGSAGTAPQVSSPPATAWPDEYRALAALGGRAFALDPAASRIRILVFRGGRLAAAGHDHVLSLPAFVGFAYLPAGNAAAARFDLEFRLDQLTLDPAELRRSVGGPFAPPIGDDDIAATRAHMLATLEAAQFPLVRLHSTGIVGEIPWLSITVAVTLHGVSHTYDVPVQVHDDAGLAASGAFVLRQSDFGITPYAALGGLLAVQDPVIIQFDLKGRSL